MASRKINPNSVKTLQSLLADVSEEDCMVLIEEYGSVDNDDLNEVIHQIFEVLSSTQLSSVTELVWNLRENPCFRGRKSRPVTETNPASKDSWTLARSRSTNTINKHMSGLPMAAQPRPASATAQMESNDGLSQLMPFSSSRHPIQIVRTPKNVETSQLKTFMSKYMQDVEMSNFMYDLYENQSNKKMLILMRGASGSGKSTLASIFWAITDRGEICSADHFFVGRNGQYRFNRASLGDAHESCRNRCRTAMRRGDTPVIIDNTNVRADEMLPYVELAVEYDYTIKFIEPNTDWKRKAGILARKNVHNVPKASIDSQLERFEKLTERTLIDRVLKIHGKARAQYKPTYELDWGASQPSPVESWTPLSSNLNSVLASPTTTTASNVFQYQNPKSVSHPKTKMSPLQSPKIQQQQPSWTDPMPVRPPSPLLLSDLVPDLKISNNSTKHKRRKSGNGNNMPPAAAALPPFTPSVFEDPAHAAFNRLIKLFPDVARDRLEEMFNANEGNIDECAFILLQEGVEMNAIDTPEVEDVVPQEVKPLEAEKFDDLLKWEDPIENTGASGGSNSDVGAKQLGSSIADYEDLESMPFDPTFDGAAECEPGITVDDGDDSFEMVLPIEFARLLLSAYGHSEDENRHLTQDELVIKVGADTAFELYKSLYINMHRSEAGSIRHDSEDSTRSNSPTSNAGNCEDDFDTIAISLSQMELETQSRNPQLASIMDIEAKISRQMQEVLQNYSAPNRSMAQNVKFSQLKQDYPYLDDAVIDEVYSQCFLDDDKTRAALNEMYPTTSGAVRGPSTVQAPEESSTWNLKYNPKDIQLYSQEELKKMERTFQELNTEWMANMVKMKDYHQKCQNTNNPQIKAHYLNEATRLTEVMKGLSDEMQYYKAISLNAKHKNEQILDLHGLRVDGAMRVLKEFLQYQEEQFASAGIPKMLLLIITGQGKHSKNGFPVLQPAVRNFLAQRRYKFHSSKPGSYNVVLTRGTVPKKK